MTSKTLLLASEGFRRAYILSLYFISVIFPLIYLVMLVPMNIDGNISYYDVIPIFLISSLFFIFRKFRKYLIALSDNQYEIRYQFGPIYFKADNFERKDIKELILEKDKKRYFLLNLVFLDGSKLLIGRAPVKSQIEPLIDQTKKVVFTTANKP
jgi:hypothetical protein